MANRDDKISPPKDSPGARGDEPGADFWSREDECELHDAALLIENIEPRPDHGLKLKKLLEGFDDRRAESLGDDDGEGAQFFRLARIVRLARAAGAKNPHEDGYLYLRIEYDPDGTPHEVVQLRRFLRWASDKGYKPPPALAPIADMKSRAELEQDVERLQAEIDCRSKSRWPWGSHTTKLLEQLATAAEKWWKEYDPADAAKAPTNEQVKKWLQEERKVGKRVAGVIAQILRADDVPMGPRAAKPKKTSRPQRPPEK